jgi:hypothetical protein
MVSDVINGVACSATAHPALDFHASLYQPEYSAL